MKMSLQNIVEFQFTANPTYGIQRLRMTPKESERQKILSWEIILKGAKKEIEYVDHHGNVCVLLTFEKDTKSVSVLAQGDVEINKTNGVTNEDSLIPKWLYKRHTELAKPGVAIKKFCRDFSVDNLNVRMKQASSDESHTASGIPPLLDPWIKQWKMLFKMSFVISPLSY